MGTGWHTILGFLAGQWVVINFLIAVTLVKLIRAL